MSRLFPTIPTIFMLIRDAQIPRENDVLELRLQNNMEIEL